jgi:hypothetical protein
MLLIQNETTEFVKENCQASVKKIWECPNFSFSS